MNSVFNSDFKRGSETCEVFYFDYPVSLQETRCEYRTPSPYRILNTRRRSSVNVADRIMTLPPKFKRRAMRASGLCTVRAFAQAIANAMEHWHRLQLRARADPPHTLVPKNITTGW